MPWMNWIHEFGMAYLISKKLICVLHQTFKKGCQMCEDIWRCLECEEVRYGDDNVNLDKICTMCGESI